MVQKLEFEDEIRHVYEETSGSLAADRQTRVLPVVLAELFFISGWVVSLVKAASSEPNPTNWVNVEAQSIAISALYLWVTSTVILASLLGASQTEDAIPRILHASEYNLATFHKGCERRLSIHKRRETGWCKRSIERAIQGGTYSWRPMKWRPSSKEHGVGAKALFAYASVAVLFIGCSFVISTTLSYLVSPRGLSCRHIVEALV
jgi:hypothetical protein